MSSGGAVDGSQHYKAEDNTGLIDSVFSRVMRPWLKDDIRSDVENGELGSAYRLAANAGIDEGYVDDYVEEVFEQKLGRSYSNAAEYTLEADLDKEWARQQALDYVEEILDLEDVEKSNRDRHVGLVMTHFNIREDEVDGVERVENHFYMPYNPAEEVLANEIVEKKSREKINSNRKHVDDYLEGTRYAFADPELTRQEIEKRAVGEQTEIHRWQIEDSEPDVYSLLGIEWAGTEELEEFISSFEQL